MLTLALKPLRTAVISLGLFAAMASAQAALTIHFEENVVSRRLKVSFSGEQNVSFNAESPGSSITNLSTYGAHVNSSGNFWVLGFGWAQDTAVPWTNPSDSSPFDVAGAGGFWRNSSVLQLESTTSTGKITWDGQFSINGNLADISLSDGQSGTITFSNSTDTITVNWSAVAVPEPATYAASLGLGIAGFALYRRRTSRR